MTRKIISLIFLISFSSCTNKKEEESTESSFVKNENTTGVIIFVHGIFGDAIKTWQNESTQEYFPKLLKQDSVFKNYDVFTYGFDTPRFGQSLNIDESGENLRSNFESYNLNKYSNIIFICHSMGGLIVRSFLQKYGTEYEITPKVKLIYFYATPSNGSQIATWAKNFSRNPQLKDMTANQAQGYLGNLLNQWLANKSLSSIPSYAAYENLSTNSITVVDKFSALLLINRRIDPLSFNHIDMVKPKNNHDQRYLVFRNAFLNENNINKDSVKLIDVKINESQGATVIIGNNNKIK